MLIAIIAIVLTFGAAACAAGAIFVGVAVKPVGAPELWNALTTHLGFSVPDADHLIPTIGLIVVGVLFLADFLASLKLVAITRRVMLGACGIFLSFFAALIGLFAVSTFALLDRPMATLPMVLSYIGIGLLIPAAILRIVTALKD